MLFNSIDFLIFFPLVTLLYFVLPYSYRWLLLLVASCWFYMAFIPYYILILGFTIVVDYFAGIYIERTKDPRFKKSLLVASIIANIGTLVFFKYFNFLNENVSDLLSILNVQNPVSFLNIVLPIGLSFHTFQALSYTIEVYRGKQSAEKHFGLYSLYVLFYPQLVAGPIERPQHVLPQFRINNDFNVAKASSGLRLMAWGFFKKLVIADRVAVAVNSVYNTPENHGSVALIIATFFFAIQIYCDFSGYTDIARGAARVMGYELMQNFKSPYLSSSVTEFWQRWHISLSTWFRDYLYIPLGGNRVSIPRWYVNLLIVFLVSGLWHGANWTFIVWGALHGIVIIIEATVKRFSKNQTTHQKSHAIIRAMKTVFTFILVSLIWIFFRANTIDDAIYILRNIFSWNQLSTFEFTVKNISKSVGLVKSEFFIGLYAIVLLLLFENLNERFNMVKRLLKQHIVIRMGVYTMLILIIIIFGNYTGLQQFIYFQF